VQAGDLDQRVKLYHRALRGDGSGGATNTPSLYATVWAKVDPVRGAENKQAQRQDAVSNYIVTIRSRTDVVEGDTIVWRSRTMNVRFVHNKGPREQWLRIDADLGAPV
jgi:SPP1 family predicted phage head-tail adaptor